MGAAALPPAPALRTATLNGRVVDAVGAAIPFATVAVNAGVKRHAEVHAARDGAFQVDGVLPGVYEIEVYAAGFQRSRVQSIQLVAGSTVELGTIRLQVGLISGCSPEISRSPTFRFELCVDCATALEGRVARTWNLPLSGVEVAVLRGSGELIARMVTGPDGKFAFAGLQPGLYVLRASKPEHAGFVIDAVAIHAGQRTRINEYLPLNPCPVGATCAPAKMVDRDPTVCL